MRHNSTPTQLSRRSFRPLALTGKRLSHWSGIVVTVLCVVGITAASKPTAGSQDVEIKVGIVQRFGEEPTDQLALEATPGDQLTLSFLAGNMQPQTLQTTSVKLETAMQPLPEPQLEERVVLDNHRSFESAENSAQKWRSQGIEVEITQPERWQVWAKRSVYKTPLLRRWLLQSLKAQGNQTAFLETEMLQKRLKVSWVVNGFRYSRNDLKITSSKNLIQVKQGKDERAPTRLYAGQMKLQPNAYSTYTLVNQVPLEIYLRGVVPHEIGAGAPYAAVEAQTIIARTYALRNLRRFAVDGYQLCADTHCQVYRGLTGTDPTADRAIAASRGKVLTYQNELVDALYSATTGGVTAPFGDVWNGSDRPYLRAVVDSAGGIWNLSQQNLSSEENFRKFISLNKGFNEDEWPAFRWRRQSTIEQITKDLQRYFERTKSSFANIKTVKQLRIVERSPAGRILKMAVETDKGVAEIFKDDVRSAFFAPRSTLFYLEPIYGADKTLKGYAFVGGGFGHGVGLSQSGSYNLAKLGWSGTRILGFYYPDTEIQPFNESITLWRDLSAVSTKQR